MLDRRRKIADPESLTGVIADLKAKGKKVVQCHGVFDILHRGHLDQFDEARRQGDILVVSLTTDQYVNKGPDRPVFTLQVRMEMMAAQEVVDYVTFCDAPSSVDLIKLLKPDVYVKGKSYEDAVRDHSGRIVLEQEAVESVGGRIHFAPEPFPIHGTSLINAYVNPYPPDVVGFLTEFKRHYTSDRVMDYLSGLRGLRVLIVGEAIIDKYDKCEPMGISPKGQTIPVRHISSELFAGGSLACANHVANFCSDVRLVANLGTENSHEKFVRNHLASNIAPAFLMREGQHTIVKQRQLDPAYLRKITETYFFDDRPLEAKEEDNLIQLLDLQIRGVDLVLVVDYGHGLITPRIINHLANQSPFLAVNTQTNAANNGFHVIHRYPRADYVCIDHQEARLTLRDKYGDISQIAQRIQKDLKSGTTAVTLGHKGSLMRDRTREVRTPVFSRKVIDTIGAGDAFLSVTSPCVAGKVPLEVTAFLGNLAGALATGYLGNQRSVTFQDLLGFTNSLLG